MDYLEDQRNLKAFLDKTEEILQYVVDSRNILFRRELRDPLYNAWKKLKNWDPSLRKGYDSIFYKAKLAIDDAVETLLEGKGLTGEQLNLKLEGFIFAYNEFKQWGTIKLLKKVLDWINNLLDSLKAALPVIEPISEFKKACETGIDVEGGRVLRESRFQDLTDA